MTPLLGQTTITLAQAEAWARKNNAHPRFLAVLPLYFEHAARYGIPAEVGIAQAAHETAFGRYTGVVPPEYHNWCGLKTKRATGDKPEDHMRFPSDSMGVIAHLQHIWAYAGKPAAELPDTLVDPRYELVTKHTDSVEGLGGAWAPSPTYGNMVAAHVAALRATVAPMTAFEMPTSINGIPVRKAFIPATNSNRPGLPVTAEGAQWITVHETGNPSVGANAEMHRRFTHNGGGAGPGNDGVSFTFVVDDTEIVWLLPLEERSWQASDGVNGPGNSSTSIETCINSDGDFARACENVAQLVAWLAVNHPQKSVERVAQHNKWARDGKNCPARMRANNGAGWNALMARVRALATPKLVIPGTPGGYGFVAGFRAYVEALGRCRYPQDVNAGIASVVGLPLEDEWRGADGLTYQRTERAILQWNPNNAPPFDVVILPRGAALPDKAA